MPSMSVSLHSVPGTGAALGWADGHTIVVDRPEGRAGGTGLGFNGGQLIAFAIGGCLCNDLRYTAEKMQIAIGSLAVHVNVQLDGEPLMVRTAEVTVHLEGDTPVSDFDQLLRQAVQVSAVRNSVVAGFPVTVKGHWEEGEKAP